MALISRRYVHIGPTDAMLAKYVDPAANVATAYPHVTVDLNVENDPDSFTTADSYMELLGFAPDNAAEPNILNTFTVGKGGPVQYTSIKDAVDAAVAAGASEFNPVNVLVSSGVYVEDPFTVPTGVIVSSQADFANGVIVVASNPAADLVTLIGGSLTGFTFSGVTDPTKALIHLTAGLSQLLAIRVLNCSTGILVSGGAFGSFNDVGAFVDIPGASITNVLLIDGGGAAIIDFYAIVPPGILPFYPGVNPIENAITVRGITRASLAAGHIDMPGNLPTTIGVKVDDGAELCISSIELLNIENAVVIGAVGANTRIEIVSCAMFGNTANITIQSATGVFLVSAITESDTRNITPGGQLTGNILNTDGTNTDTGLQYHEYTPTIRLETNDFMHYASATGISRGGVVTATGGLGVDVSAGSAFIQLTPIPVSVREVSFPLTSLVLTDNATNFVYYDGVSDTIVAGLAPPGDGSVLFATIVTGGGAIRFQHNTSWLGATAWESWVDYLIAVRKIRVASGLITTQGSTVRKLDISNGLWYRAMTPLTYAGGADVTWSYFYGLNGVSEVAAQTQLDITQYDNAGVLTAMAVGFYRQDVVIITGDGRISVLYGVSEHALAADAESAASTPTPTFIEETGARIAHVIVQQGVGIDSIVDVRPLDTGGGGAGSTTGVTDHSALASLLADDHPQYLLTDGSRPLTGMFLANGQNFDSAGTINGVTITAHADRHAPGAVDALALGAPVATLVGVAPDGGAAASYSRSDHQHGVAAGVAPGTVTFGAPAEGGSSSVARADHTHGLDNPADPANVTKAAASAGVSANVAREDHKHDIDTAAAVDVGAANAEGAATTLARSNHTHRVVDLAIAGQVQGDIIYFNGANWVRLAPGVAGQVLRTGGPAANPSWVNQTASAIFGTQYAKAESLGASTTAAAGYNNKLTFNTAVLPAGDYIIEWSYTLGNATSNASSRGRVQVDAVTTLQEVLPASSVAAWKESVAGQAVVTLTAASHAITIDYSRVSGGTASIQDARLTIWRVA